MNKRIIFLANVVLVASCTSQTIPVSVTASITPPPSKTASVTSSPTSSQTRTLTPTITSLPDDLIQILEETCRALALIDLEAGLFQGTLEGIIEGRANGEEVTLLTVTISGLLEGAESNIYSINPPKLLADSWESIMLVHKNTSDVFHRWVAQTINEEDAFEEMVSIVDLSNETIAITQIVLTEVYGFDQKYLDDLQREIIEYIFEPLLEGLNTPEG